MVTLFDHQFTPSVAVNVERSCWCLNYKIDNHSFRMSLVYKIFYTNILLVLPRILHMCVFPRYRETHVERG